MEVLRMLNILLCWKQNCQNWWSALQNIHEEWQGLSLSHCWNMCRPARWHMEMSFDSFWSDRFLLLHNENNVCLYLQTIKVSLTTRIKVKRKYMVNRLRSQAENILQLWEQGLFFVWGMGKVKRKTRKTSSVALITHGRACHRLELTRLQA